MHEWEFEDTGEAVTMQLEDMAGGGYESIPVSEMMGDFVANTSHLTPTERMGLVSAAVGSESISARDVGQGFQIGSQVLQTLTGLGAAIASAVGGRDGQQAARVLQGIGGIGGAVGGTVGGILQQYGRPQQGQVPPIPSQAPPQAPPPQLNRPPVPSGTPNVGTGTAPGAAGGFNAAALLQQLFSSPALAQGLAQGILGGSTAPREVVLEIAGNDGQSEQVGIPLGAVMNTISHLASEAMLEFNAATHPSESDVPEYLVGESGEFIVDPGDPAARAALVLNYFRRAQAQQQVRPSDDNFFDF
jgi:hypothetical protein